MWYWVCPDCGKRLSTTRTPWRHDRPYRYCTRLAAACPRCGAVYPGPPDSRRMHIYLLRRLLGPIAGAAVVCIALISSGMPVAGLRDLALAAVLLCIFAAWGLFVVAQHIRRMRRISVEWRSCRRKDDPATGAALPLTTPVVPQLRRHDNTGTPDRPR
jgi:hypothetical protein